MNSRVFLRVLMALGACDEAIEFVDYCHRSGLKEAQEIWCICDVVQWMRWLCVALKIEFQVDWASHDYVDGPCPGCLHELDSIRDSVDWGLVEKAMLGIARKRGIR